MTDISLDSGVAVQPEETTHFGFKTVAKEDTAGKVADVFHSEFAMDSFIGHIQYCDYQF